MARTFNGTNACLVLASAPVTGLPLTLAGWVWLNNLSGYYQLIALSHATTSGVVSIQYGTGFGFRAWHNDDANSNQGAYFNTGISAGRWYHLCGVFVSGTSRQIYVDGVLGASNTGTSGATTLNRCVVAARMMAGGTANTDFLPGRIAEVSAWNVALSAEEVAALGKGYRPAAIRPASQRLDLRCIRSLQDLRAARGITEIGTASTVIDHPRIIYPC